jgi:hypothetical protein
MMPDTATETPKEEEYAAPPRPAPTFLRPKVDGAAFRRVSPVPDDVAVTASREVAARHGAIEPDETNVPIQMAVRRGPKPRSPIAPNLEMPHDGETVDWTGHFRAELPTYVIEQVQEFAHIRRCTIVAAILHVLSQHVGDEGKPVFFIRREDLVHDRRKVMKLKRNR